MTIGSQNPSFTYNKDGSLSVASGKEAVMCIQVATLIQAIKMMRTTRMIPTRGYTMKKGLTMASTFTGRTYKRTEAAQAEADLKVWLETMKSTIPVEGGEA